MKSKTTIGMQGKMIEVKACPCCGNPDLYTGHNSCDTMGVSCWNIAGGCGLKLSVCVEETWEESGYVMETAEALALKLAVKRWNRRA
jgi:hypothetical protein